MGPRPYSENSSLPNDSSITDPITSIPTQVLAETPSPSTLSGATTPSPTPQEIIPVEQHIDAVDYQDDMTLDTTTPCYPSPEDIMPYDHSLPDFIRQVTNQPNLANLRSLSLRVISSCISLHRMAAYLPNLKELDLEGSILNSLRDIGCSFKNLRILKVGRCQLESLDGTFGLSSLRELYAQRNLINDVSPCSNLPHIKHIDVSRNRIRNISYAGFLSVCSKLKSIVFTGNPATEVPDYRKHVRNILPQVEVLDGIPFANEGENCDGEECEKDTEFDDNAEDDSDLSAEIPDFYCVSPSDSLSNFFDSEEEFNFQDKKYKQAKNVTNHDQFERSEYEEQMILPSTTADFKTIEQKGKKVEGVVEQSKIIRIPDDRNKTKYKCTSIQKLDKDIENRCKKSNLLMSANYNEEICLPEIVPGGSNSSDVSSTTQNDTILPSPSEINTRSVGNSSIASGDQFDIERKISLASGNFKNSHSLGKYNQTLGVSSLTSGLPVRGNLTVALRNRNKIQMKEGKTSNDGFTDPGNTLESDFDQRDVDYLKQIISSSENL